MAAEYLKANKESLMVLSKMMRDTADSFLVGIIQNVEALERGLMEFAGVDLIKGPMAQKAGAILKASGFEPGQ